jgi:hypothetical protein
MQMIRFFKLKYVFLFVLFLFLTWNPGFSQNHLSAEKWQEDLRVMAEKLANNHRNAFHKISRESFEKAVANLEKKIPELQDHEVIVHLAKIAAMLGDGHTRLTLPQGKHAGFSQAHTSTPAPKIKGIFFRQYPVRLYLFKDALFVLGTVERKQLEVRLKPLEPEAEEQWKKARDMVGTKPPLYLEDTKNPFHFTYLKDAQIMYVQINAVRDKPGESLARFSRRVVDFAEKNPLEKFVLDIRLNGGGNNYLNRSLILGLVRSKKINRYGRFFTIIGRHTFSAAMNTERR